MSNRINRTRRHSAAPASRPTATRTCLAAALLVALSGTALAAPDAQPLEAATEQERVAIAVAEQAPRSTLSTDMVTAADCGWGNACTELVGAYIGLSSADGAGDAVAVDFGYGSIAMGGSAKAETGGVSIGASTQSVDQAVAVGTGAIGGTRSVAVGSNTYTKTDGTAVGVNASASGTNAVALGANSIANIANTVSIGSSGNERRLVNVAAGSALTDAVNMQQLNAVADADLVVYRDDLDKKAIYVGENALGDSVEFAGVNGARRLSGVRSGIVAAGSSDAVNGSQLFSTNSKVSANESSITTLTGSLGDLDGRVTVNEGDIALLRNRVEAGEVGLVTFDDGLQVVNVADGMGGTRVEFGGVDGARVLAGVADGELDAGSDEAVNGGQLHATNEDVADNALAIDALDGRVSINEGEIIALDGRVGVNEDDIKALSGQIGDLTEGSAGLVTHDAVTGITSIAGGKGGDVIDMRGTDGLRRLTGVADGVDDQDAVTVAQLRAVGLVDPVTGMPLNALTYDDLSLGRVSLGGAQGTIIDNLADGRIAFDSREAINGRQLATVIEGINKTINAHGDRLTELNEALANHLIEGTPDPVNGGGDSDSSNGYNAENGSVAIGDGDKAGAGSIELGQGAVADGGDQVAIGHDAQAGGEQSVAIGSAASASGSNSVAIGAGSVADRDNTVAVGSAGNERVISHVADGVQATDAVNLRQLDDRFQQSIAHTEQRFHHLDQRIDRMASLSAAYAGMALNTAGLEGRNRVGVGIGAQNGKEAMAVGYQRVMGKRNNISVSLGGAFSGSETSVSAGAGLSW